MSRVQKLKTLSSLGWLSVARVAFYRLACKSGLYRWRLPISRCRMEGTVFSPGKAIAPAISGQSQEALLKKGRELLDGEMTLFSAATHQLGSPPDWFADPIGGKEITSKGHWSKVDEFSGGDIKVIWEASRFEWAPRLAQAWRLSGDDRYLEALNGWVRNWIERNPWNEGPNWKCGQEASIRVMNLLLSAKLFGCERQASEPLIELVRGHCRRIQPTIGYAIGQNNNHGTSEAAALFIGGSWLLSLGVAKSEAKRWQRTGRKWLENRVETLVREDGSFSQYSANYHRVLVDTLCQVELWRRELGEDTFPESYDKRCSAAVEWLASIVDEVSGGVPNVGANDGARLFDLTTTPYGDFRPSVGLGAALFLKENVNNEATKEALSWWGISFEGKKRVADSGSVVHADGGDVVLRASSSYAMIRFSRYQFRPSHADCLHLDLWSQGINLLRDGGTYSYNKDPEVLDYFSGTESHNTVQFDERNQMPRVGRFLFASWTKMESFSRIESKDGWTAWTGRYKDHQGAWHQREVKVRDAVWRVADTIGGRYSSAVLRWRLAPGDWMIEGSVCRGELAKISILVDGSPAKLSLVEGWESRHYMEKSPIPVLEVRLPSEGCSAHTEIELPWK